MIPINTTKPLKTKNYQGQQHIGQNTMVADHSHQEKHFPAQYQQSGNQLPQTPNNTQDNWNNHHFYQHDVHNNHHDVHNSHHDVHNNHHDPNLHFKQRYSQENHQHPPSYQGQHDLSSQSHYQECYPSQNALFNNSSEKTTYSHGQDQFGQGPPHYNEDNAAKTRHHTGTSNQADQADRSIFNPFNNMNGYQSNQNEQIYEQAYSQQMQMINEISNYSMNQTQMAINALQYQQPNHYLNQMMQGNPYMQQSNQYMQQAQLQQESATGKIENASLAGELMGTLLSGGSLGPMDVLKVGGAVVGAIKRRKKKKKLKKMQNRSANNYSSSSSDSTSSSDTTDYSSDTSSSD